MSYFKTSKKIQNYTHNVDTSFTKQQLGTSIVAYNGTEITYTPPAGATSVVYECNAQFSWDPDAAKSYACTRLQYSDDNGSTWNTITGTKVLDGTTGSVNDYDCFLTNWNFLIPAWSGERKLRLAGRAFSSTNRCTLGKSFGATEDDTTSCPHVSVYSIF